jgi:formate dehydrogenase beta subunit
MKTTDISVPDYFHKVVDCQWACPAHTPVPEYIRLIAAGRYSDAYMINWESNVFPGILGRTCDRPCEPACRRGRVEKEPVAICRLKRVAADFKDDIRDRLPKPAANKNGKRIGFVGGGPASLAVARDLAPMGYECVVFDQDPQSGGMMRTQIPKFRLPESVLDEECQYILDLGIEFIGGKRIDSMKALRSSLVAARRAAAISRFQAARKRLRTSISASIGYRASRSATSTRSASASSCSAAATLRWIAAVPRAGSAARRSRSSCAPASKR